MKLVYIAGPYTGQKGHGPEGFHDIDRNISVAREAAAWCAQHDIGFFCPHTHSAHFEVITPTVPSVFWYDLDMAILAKCDAIMLLPRWEKSIGALKELAAMDERGCPVYHWNNWLELRRLEKWYKA